MKLVLLVFCLFSCLQIFAQKGKGFSIYKNFDLEYPESNAIEKIEKLKFCGTNPNSKVLYTYTFKQDKINHTAFSPFIAVSCRWEEKYEAKQNTTFEISYTVNGTQWTKFKELKVDEHFEGPKTSNVSQLYFEDNAYQYYKVRLTTNLEGTGNHVKSFKLNFFNPYGTSNLSKKVCFFSSDANLIFSSPAKVGEFIKYPISPNSLNNFDWENQLKLDYANLNFKSNFDWESTLKLEYTDKKDNLIVVPETNSTLRPQACPCPLPTYVTRTQWNCPQGQGLVTGVGTSASITHLIVHHSAGSNTATDWNAVVLSIWNFHTGTNGYSDIGYNWLVAPNGVLYEGRGSNNLTQNVNGAHFCGFNAGTMGTCMIGTFTSSDITASARGTLAKLLAWKSCQAGIPVLGTALHASSGLTLNRISGHRDGCATECPGTTLYNTLPTLRTAVQDTINACGVPPPPCAVSLSISATGCPSNTINFTPTNVQNGGAAPVFAWYLNNNFVQNGSTYTLNNAINTDKVYARMTSNATCISPTQTPVNSDTITISCIVTTSIASIDGLDYCRVSPNPNNGNFVVQINLTKSTMVRYRLSNMQGKILFNTEGTRVLGNHTKSFNQSNLSNGNYILEVFFNNKKLVYKLVVGK